MPGTITKDAPSIVCLLNLALTRLSDNKQIEHVVCEILTEADGSSLAPGHLLFILLDEKFLNEHHQMLYRGGLVVRVQEGRILEENGCDFVLDAVGPMATVEVVSAEKQKKFLPWRHRRQQEHERASQQVRTVMLVQVSTEDEMVTVGDAAFADVVFASDQYSVASHLSECSGGYAPSLIPYNTTNPVMSVQVNGTSASHTRGSMLQAAKSAVEKELNLTASLSAIVDHAIFCVPNGLSGPSFFASGAVNGFWSMAKSSQWCTNTMALQHELLHNMGLGHAGQDEDEYGDETTLMGQTYRTTSPVAHRYRCLNGQNYWKLGWFSNHTISISTTPLIAATEIELVSIVDSSMIAEGQALVIKLLDLYLVYNRQKSYNRDTGEFPNMVTVVQETSDGGTLLLAGLDYNSTESNVFQYEKGSNDMEGPLTIQICDRVEGNATLVDFFRVAVGFDEFPCSAVAHIAPSETPMLELTGFPSAAPSIQAVGQVPFATTDTMKPSSIFIENKPDVAATQPPAFAPVPSASPASGEILARALSITIPITLVVGLGIVFGALWRRLFDPKSRASGSDLKKDACSSGTDDEPMSLVDGV